MREQKESSTTPTIPPWMHVALWAMLLPPAAMSVVRQSFYDADGSISRNILIATMIWLTSFGSLSAYMIYRVLKPRSISSPEGCPCTHCGYDVRASFDRCPECGTSVKQRPRATRRDS